METTRLYLANGATRVVKGRAEDIGLVVRPRRQAEDGFRQFYTADGDQITVNAGAILMVERAGAKRARPTFGFGRALEEAA